MATVNTFFCDCGKTIGRPINKAPADDALPQYGVVPWHKRPEDAAITGIRCTCGTWWEYIKPTKHLAYADVTKWWCGSCDYMWRCEC